jgi:hypothetical protein
VKERPSAFSVSRLNFGGIEVERAPSGRIGDDLIVRTTVSHRQEALEHFRVIRAPMISSVPRRLYFQPRRLMLENNRRNLSGTDLPKWRGSSLRMRAAQDSSIID